MSNKDIKLQTGPEMPPRPKQWYDKAPHGTLAIVVECGRIWHKNCPNENHASGIMKPTSKLEYDTYSVECLHCGKTARIPKGSGNIFVTETEVKS